ncbi:hypothetical protein DJ019_09170 [Phenylobacterium kunshanense]|uniref:ArsR family transcriptional regulator n=2 Tax=Phenylobacterium kunshanense TaxID=1445034 RepID=A0A328BIB9_9CAUL|nr:hypothetical protein DJ019_09170 [Phenylobacterium kunshanense]
MQQILSDERRLAILRCLWKSPGHCANEEVLGKYLRQVALYGGCDATRSALDHLDRVGAVHTRMHLSLMVAELTRRGADAAEGCTELEGVPKVGADCPY